MCFFSLVLFPWISDLGSFHAPSGQLARFFSKSELQIFWRYCDPTKIPYDSLVTWNMRGQKISIVDARLVTVKLSICSDRYLCARARYARSVSSPVKWPHVCRSRFRAHTNHRVSHFTFGAPNKSALLSTELCPISLCAARDRLAPACHWKYLCAWQTVDCRPKIKRQTRERSHSRVCENFFISSLSLPAWRKKRNNPICSFQLAARQPDLRERSITIYYVLYIVQLKIGVAWTQLCNITLIRCLYIFLNYQISDYKHLYVRVYTCFYHVTFLWARIYKDNIKRTKLSKEI